MAAQPTTRFDVANLDQWGRLIKSWATGLDYVSEPEAPQPPRNYWVKQDLAGREPPAPTEIKACGHDVEQEKSWCLPKRTPVPVSDGSGGTVNLPFAVAVTKEDFAKRVREACVSITSIPDDVTHVVVVQGDEQTMVIRLPPKHMLQNSEDDLLNRMAYPLRPFYWALFGASPRLPKDQAGIMELHANRIGEYTLNNCA